MDNYTEIKNKIRAMVGKNTPLLLTGKVKSVDGETCTVSVGDLTLTDVRLRSVVNGESSKLLVTPEEGSYVTLIDLSGELRETEVIGYSQIKAIDIDTSGDIKINCHGNTDIDCDGTITLNGGDNKGLVNIKALKDNLDELRHYVLFMRTQVAGGLAHVGTGDICDGAGASTYFSTKMATQSIRFADMEDQKVKH